MATVLATDTKDAMCLSGTSQTATFNDYITKCRSTNDTRMSTNFFSEAKENIKSTFESLRAQFDDLIMTGDSIDTMANLTGTTTGAVDNQILELRQKKENLLKEIKHYKRISDSANKTFLEDIYNGTPQKELAPSLQDVAMLLFWFSWIVMIFTLTAVRWFSPGGTWRAGLFTLLLLLLVSVCVYALLVRVA
jgi:hypothetical protein